MSGTHIDENVQAAINTYLQYEDTVKKSNAVLKPIRASANAAKEVIYDCMVTKKLPYISAPSHGRFVKLVQKKSKPVKSDEFLRIVYSKHVRDNLKREVSDKELQAYMKVVWESVEALTETKVILQTASAVPVASLLC